MFTFMDYVQQAFYTASSWNNDNSYAHLTATAQSLLDFDIPRGLRLSVSSLSSANFAASYTLGSVGVVDGSLSYLYSSLPLRLASKSGEIDIRDVVRGYRRLHELRAPDDPDWWELWQRGKQVDTRNTLLYGRMFLPASHLEALYLRRINPTRQLKLSAVSDGALANGGTILAVLQNDHGKYCTEYLYSTDSGLLGVRGLYNFGPDPRHAGKLTATTAVPTTLEAAQAQSELGTSPNTTSLLPSTAISGGDQQSPPDPSVVGRFSAGAELYYGLFNKSGGVSTGVRFTTLPRHTGFPYTMTLTLNPLMGNLSSTYAVQAGRNLALCSRFGFNFYSYESEVQLGVELWKRNKDNGVGWALEKIAMSPFSASFAGSTSAQDAEMSTTRTKEAAGATAELDDPSGVLKARVDQNWRIGVLWEGRIKELLFSMGASFDLRRRDQIFRGCGIEVAYSS